MIQKANDFVLGGLQSFPVYVKNIFTVFSIIILIPMLVFFMLLGGSSWINLIVDIVPSDFVESILSIFYEIDSMLGKFIRGQLIEAGFIAVMVTIVMSFFNINFALLIGIGSGIANFIPYFGSITGTVLACLIGIFQYQDVFIILKIIPSFIIIQFIDNHAVQPFVLGHNVNLSPIMIIFVILAGSHVFGFIGLVFAVPAAAIIKSVFFLFLRKYKNSVSS